MFPLFEYISVYLLCTIIGHSRIHYFFSTQISSFVKIATPISLLLFLYSILAGLNFGPFRANVGLVTINRWPDFITPLFSFVAFAVKPSLLLAIITFVSTSITLYRTVYVAIIFMSLFLILSRLFYNINLSFNYSFLLRIKKRFLCIMLLLFTLLYFLSRSLSLGDSAQVPDFFTLFSSILSRFLSLFQSEPISSNSLSSRIDQIPLLFSALSTQLTDPFALLFGSNTVVGSEYAFNYAFYPIVSLLVFGWPITLLFSHIIFSVYPLLVSSQILVLIAALIFSF